jgi:predicted XRE-type DNA-binding protein
MFVMALRVISMRLRVTIDGECAAMLKKRGWTQVEAAPQCGVTQPRINDLLRGRVSRFSLDAFVNIATAIGSRAHAELEPA